MVAVSGVRVATRACAKGGQAVVQWRRGGPKVASERRMNAWAGGGMAKDEGGFCVARVNQDEDVKK